MARLRAQYNAGPGTNASELTVQRTLLDIVLRSRCPSRVSLLTKCNPQLLPQ